MWGPIRAPIYKASFWYDRFVPISKDISFDNVNLRTDRLLTGKTDAIDDTRIWLILQANLANLREVNQGHYVVTDFIEKYLDVGWTVHAVDFFTTLDVAKILMRRNNAFIGTVRSNKAFVTPEFLKSNTRPVCSTLFAFLEDDILLCSCFWLFYEWRITKNKLYSIFICILSIWWST